ncbi:antitoxin MazE-like protein [uncultured Sulfitobacter sp.]|uniref:antitoxin MazE-like protein n=1 Tax=uncultured Sulfitobacter sp. TaxID=191468 RepID=UPI0026368E9C|nr:antitoxin MazE-like protein [uncultured Sulfitobacter sp.]
MMAPLALEDAVAQRVNPVAKHLINRGLLRIGATDKVCMTPEVLVERFRAHLSEIAAHWHNPHSSLCGHTRRPGFEVECRRHVAIVAKADRADDTPSDFLNAALVDVDGWE